MVNGFNILLCDGLADRCRITEVSLNKGASVKFVGRYQWLVLPIEEAFETGETPINLDASKIDWSVPPDMPAHDPGVEVAQPGVQVDVRVAAKHEQDRDGGEQADERQPGEQQRHEPRDVEERVERQQQRR